jgi:PHD/YefM family antitoxin component YafN of YafNO toxin-antitoxin module
MDRSRQMNRKLNISEARGRLPEIAKFLSSHPEQVILVEHRDLPETMALTTASHLRYLETMVEELRKQASRPFRLAGSITSSLSDEELDRALAEGRKLQAERARRRLTEFEP